jgi:hypothetical protein
VTRVTAHPDVNFTVILNPDSGPGSTQYPCDDYVSQIQRLNAYPNIQTVGYVPTAYATRNITSVLQDVSTYSGWASYATSPATTTSLALHGIFFDEVVSEYSAEAVDYMKTINQAVKNASGLVSNRTVRRLTYFTSFFREPVTFLNAWPTFPLSVPRIIYVVLLPYMR